MADKQIPKFINAKRRGFLQGAAVAGAAVAGGAAIGSDALTDAVPAQGSGELKVQKGYTRTEHVQKYYQRARF
jgi:hypothetical protein